MSVSIWPFPGSGRAQTAYLIMPIFFFFFFFTMGFYGLKEALLPYEFHRISISISISISNKTCKCIYDNKSNACVSMYILILPQRIGISLFYYILFYHLKKLLYQLYYTILQYFLYLNFYFTIQHIKIIFLYNKIIYPKIQIKTKQKYYFDPYILKS